MTARLRARLAVGLVVAAAAFNLEYLARVVDRTPASGTVDRVTRAERRYDPIRADLPRSGVVGYVLKARSPARLDWLPAYGLFFAQYTLAPLQVAEGDGCEVVIEEFDDEVRVTRGRGR